MFKLFARGLLALACALPAWAVAQQTAQSSYTINDTAQNLEELSTQLKLAFLS